ncbi:hypothetical protein NFI96_005899, partial [Prochilodus magdalenae]
MEEVIGGLGRCSWAFWLAVVFDSLGLMVLLLGVFADLFFYDFLIYAGAIVIFLSLIWWVFWYTGNIEVPPEQLEEDDVGLLKKKEKGLGGVLRRFSTRLSSGIRTSIRRGAANNSAGAATRGRGGRGGGGGPVTLTMNPEDLNTVCDSLRPHRSSMEVEKDFLNTPPRKTVRFGGSVVNTLAKLDQGDSSDYELIKHQLADPDIKDAQIINWLQEFRTCITQLGKDHEQLIYCALRLPWLDRSPAVVEEYLAFLGNLISAQTVYLRPCLKMLISNLTPKRIKIQEGNVDISDSDDDDENLPRIFDLCHQALQMVARYVPSTSRFLMPILTDNFPFVQKSSRTLECYVHNLLRITVYIPTLRKDVLELIISKMLMLD